MRSGQTNFDFLAVVLVLTEPFVELIYTNGFVFEFANLIFLLGYAALALAITLFLRKYPNRTVRAVALTILIALFLDVRANIFEEPAYLVLLAIAGSFFVIWVLHANAGKILTAVFGVILVFIFFLPVLPHTQDSATANRPATTNSIELPTYVHIVLDEFMGTEALDERIDNQRNLKQQVEALFVGNGFRLYGRAYSEYFDTRDSLAAMFNGYSGDQPGQFYSSRNEVFNTVTRNRYLREIFASGYAIRVYQASYLDFCSAAAEIIDRCLTYSPFLGVTSEALRQLAWPEKLTLVWSVLWRRSVIKKNIQRLYARAATLIGRGGASAADPELQRFVGLGPIPTLQVFDRLISDVASAPQGTMFFAHLLIPHSPYSVDRDCKIRRPVVDWKLIDLPTALADGRVNTDRSRAARYDDYTEQAQCALKKIDELIAAMRTAGIFDKSIIIIHGDHGSKISRYRPRKFYRDKLSERDYYDGFPTLFAIKAPHIEPGYDLRMLPLVQLLRHATGAGSDALDEPENPFVFLRDEPPGSTFIKVPLPPIPGG